jgi:hypothetical protein
MVDDTTPVPPAEPASTPADTTAPAPAAPRRKVWPFVLGGGILLLVLVVVGAVVLVGGLLRGGDPATTVLDFDKAFATADCALFQATTTPAFQESFFGDTFACDAWVENAKALTVDGEYLYTVEVTETTVTDDEADVATSETDSSQGAATDYELVYHLIRDGGSWRIDSIDNVTS